MSYNGIGLSTARGSGTNGYIVRNLGFLRQRRNEFHKADPYEDEPTIRKPNPELVLHEQKRSIEVKCMTLQDELEDEGVPEEEVERQVSALRAKLASLLEKATEAAALAAKRAEEKEAAAMMAIAARAEARTAEKAASAASATQRSSSPGARRAAKSGTSICFAISLCFQVAIAIAVSFTGFEADSKTQGHLGVEIPVGIKDALSIAVEVALGIVSLEVTIVLQVVISIPLFLTFSLKCPVTTFVILAEDEDVDKGIGACWISQRTLRM
ncbi:RNA-splicing factor [Dissophora globulifera]|nr:RNA-splicing factor [Dissophora globulifera]